MDTNTPKNMTGVLSSQKVSRVPNNQKKTSDSRRMTNVSDKNSFHYGSSFSHYLPRSEKLRSLAVEIGRRGRIADVETE